jgi:hypothetical protein
MNRNSVFLELARRLESAAAAGDWAALARADAEVAAALSALSARGVDAQRAALERLQSAHRAAARRCDDACADLESHLGALARNKDGWIAYAMNGGQGQEAA